MPNPFPPKAAPPPPKARNGETVAAAKAEAANAEEEGGGCSLPPVVSAGDADLKVEIEAPPRVLNGDFFEPAKDANLDEAKADAEVMSCSFFSVLSFGVSSEGLDDIKAKGDTPEVFENGFGGEI